MLDEKLYREIFSKLVTGIIIVSKEGKILDANFTVENILGYSHDELRLFSLQDIILPDDFDIDNETANDLIEGRIPYYNVEKRFIRSDEITVIWGFITVFAINRTDPMLVYMIEDISARKSAESYLNYVSTHDKLTGLYNRAFFDLEMNSLKSGQLLPATFIVIDVDGLKALNDSKGHEAGDYLISSVAKVLQQAFSAKDIIARTGGDEFTIILHETKEDLLPEIFTKILESKERFNSSGPKYQVEFSLGAATAYKSSEVDSALKKADEAMYQNKTERKALRNL